MAPVATVKIGVRLSDTQRYCVVRLRLESFTSYPPDFRSIEVIKFLRSGKLLGERLERFILSSPITSWEVVRASPSKV